MQLTGGNNTITFDSSAIGNILEVNMGSGQDVINITTTQNHLDLAFSTITFEDHSIVASDIDSGSTDQYGRKYTLAENTLTITDDSDSLTINNFHNGDFGVDIAPENTVSGARTVAQGVAASISGISVASANAADDVITVGLTGTGLLSVSGTAGTITGSGTNHLTISGTKAQVNAHLATLSYINNSAGTDSISITTEDGHGGNDTDQIAVTSLAAVNDNFVQLFQLLRVA